MIVSPTALPDVLLIEPRLFGDERGFFYESWNRAAFAANGLDIDFVQDNHSRSARGVLRGMHYQLLRPQGKLVRVTAGRAFDVAVDLRRSSPHFGRWTGFELSAANKLMLWIPPGFAHGFLALEPATEFLYKCTAPYDPADERCLRWDDPEVGIAWPLDGITPQLSDKDRCGVALADAETYA